MPKQNGRMTPKEREFVKHMVRTNDPVYAATKAGYSDPERSGYRNASNPALQEATKQQVERWLNTTGAALGVYVLTELAISTAQPGSVRVRAASKLVDLAGVGVSEADAGKELHEMTGDELANHLAKLEKQRQAIEHAMSDHAKPIIQHEKSDVFG